MDALSIALIATSGVLLVMVILLVIYVVRLQKNVVTQASRTEEVLDALEKANSVLAENKSTLGFIQDTQVVSVTTQKQQFESIQREFSQSGEKMDGLRRDTVGQIDSFRKDTTEQLDGFRKETATQLDGFRKDTTDQLDGFRKETTAQLDGMRRETTDQLSKNREGIEQRLDHVRSTVDKQLGDIRQDNTRQLESMRQTVDEKLSKTLNDRLSASFKQVSDQLESVYKGLGDMQQVASGVGDLKRVLSNVKTRGILGEIQLGAILSDILTPEQYSTNIATVPGSSNCVEFAVKIPMSDGGFIYLPIDSKYPGDTYEHLLDALDSGDKERAAEERKNLANLIKKEANDIYTKYVCVPETTNFGIMFLPFEGLYAEVVNMPGLLETLSRNYHVNVAGPSTMAAILNSLQMSYQTISLQKHADEVMLVLQAVKAELGNYQDMLRTARKQITTAGNTVDLLIGRRTRAMERKLKGITAMEDGEEAKRLLGIGDDEEWGENNGATGGALAGDGALSGDEGGAELAGADSAGADGIDPDEVE